MAEFRLSTRAEADFDGIAAYTVQAWGVEQCARYLRELELCCQRLADEPLLGRACDHTRPGLRCHPLGKHIIYFRAYPYGIRVVTVLHERMLPELHLADADDDDDG